MAHMLFLFGFWYTMFNYRLLRCTAALRLSPLIIWSLAFVRFGRLKVGVGNDASPVLFQVDDRDWVRAPLVTMWDITSDRGTRVPPLMSIHHLMKHAHLLVLLILGSSSLRCTIILHISDERVTLMGALTLYQGSSTRVRYG